MKSDFSHAKTGDKVWFLRKGWGEITDINFVWPYPIRVCIDGHTYGFTKDGKEYVSDVCPSLFWQEFEVPEKAFQKPLPDLAVDTPILVRDRENDSWFRKHFSHFENGRVVCFSRGKTSFTTSQTIYWKYWKLPETESEDSNG